MRRISLFLMALLLTTALGLPVWAADSDAGQAADTLYSLGLFRGTGTDEQGQPRFDLERPALRSEAVVMLIRLMGREKEALACTAAQPFTDVPQWADRYVAYAYEQGLTNGIGGGQFGSDLETTGNMYLAFVLRALGYRDSGAEAAYTYATAAEFAAQIGVTDRAYTAGQFLRGDIAEVSLSALSFPLYGTERLLIQALVEDGAVSAASAQAAGFPVDGSSLVGQKVSIAVVKQEYDAAILDAAQIKRAFPTACQFYRGNYWQETEEQVMEVAKTPSTSLEELLVLEAMLNDHFGDIPLEPVTDSALYFNPVDEEDYRPLLLLLDHNSNVVGMCNSYDGGDTVVFTRTNIQAVSLLEEFLAQVAARLARKDQVEVAVDTSDPQGGWNDGTGMAYHYPVYIDGEELAGDYWLALDLDYQWKLDGIQNNGGSFDTYLEYMMSNLLLGGSMITMTDDNGREHSYGELSEEYQSIYAYDEHWDRDGNLISARYGLYTSAQRSQPLFVGVCDKEGNLLGYTILEATK